MRRRADFTTAVQGGRRGPARRLVVHLAIGDSAEPCTVGFVVSRAVGGAVQRNVVKRRLRALMASRLGALPQGARVVVRALPTAAGAGSDVLARDLDHALRSAGRVGVAR
jgi:ribonuclease P protein component